MLGALKAFQRTSSGAALAANRAALARVVEQWREQPPIAVRSQAS